MEPYNITRTSNCDGPGGRYRRVRAYVGFHATHSLRPFAFSLKHSIGDESMPPRKKKPVHYTSFSFNGGAAFSVSPARKPYTKKGKQSYFTQEDPDLVCVEFFEGPEYAVDLTDEYRQHVSGILANRINTRRALRELVLPELESLRKSVAELTAKIDQLLANRDH